MQSIDFGGSFFGAYTLSSKTWKSARDLAAQATIDYKGAFTAAGAAKFESSISSFASKVETHTTVECIGAPCDSPPTITEPTVQIGARYTAWSQSISDTQHLLSIQLQRVGQVSAIQRVLLEMQEDDKHHWTKEASDQILSPKKPTQVFLLGEMPKCKPTRSRRRSKILSQS